MHMVNTSNSGFGRYLATWQEYHSSISNCIIKYVFYPLQIVGRGGDAQSEVNKLQLLM